MARLAGGLGPGGFSPIASFVFIRSTGDRSCRVSGFQGDWPSPGALRSIHGRWLSRRDLQKVTLWYEWILPFEISFYILIDIIILNLQRWIPLIAAIWLV